MRIRSEAELIESIAAMGGRPRRGEIVLGIGDDCAVLKKSKNAYWVIGCDMLVEGDHFSLDYFKAEQVGVKAMESNISDIAAMGGRPKYAFISLALKTGTSMNFVKGFYRGIYKSARRDRVEVLGGDTTHGKANAVSITVMGECRKENLCLRSGAKAGDYIFVTGKLGASAAGLKAFLKKKKGFNFVKRKHLMPKARTGLGERIGKFANAMEDVSDGLASEVRNICRASGKGAVIFAEKVPIAAETKKAAKAMGNSALDYALFGGEDFELVFTCNKKNLKKLGKFGAVVGKIIKGKKIYLEKDGKQKELEKFGYDHFA